MHTNPTYAHTHIQRHGVLIFKQMGQQKICKSTSMHLHLEMHMHTHSHLKRIQRHGVLISKQVGDHGQNV